MQHAAAVLQQLLLLHWLSGHIHLHKLLPVTPSFCERAPLSRHRFNSAALRGYLSRWNSEPAQSRDPGNPVMTAWACPMEAPWDENQSRTAYPKKSGRRAHTRTYTHT
eukprot:265427-Chlamydomonas_euryale.AAC.6